MARKLSEKELRRIERWSRRTELDRILHFFENLPRHVVIPRPLLLGSTRGAHYRVEGYATTSQIIRKIHLLDEPFQEHPIALTRTIQMRKRSEDIQTQIAEGLGGRS